MAAAKSSYIQLYDEESKHDDYKFQLKNVQAKLSFVDSASARDMEFETQQAFKFKVGTNDAFDLVQRFADAEADIDALEADTGVATNAAAIAAMDVAYKAKDAQIEAAASAEVTRASQAEAANAAAITAEETRALAAEAVNAAAVVSEASARATAVTAEETRALAAEASLQSQITNILSNTDATALNSLAEIVSHISSEDATLAASIASLQSSFDDLKDRVDELTNSS